MQATIECGFTLKCVRDIARTYSQMHLTDKFSEQISFIWPVWPNDWVFVYELSGTGFESNCSHSLITWTFWLDDWLFVSELSGCGLECRSCHLNFRYLTCFEKGVPWRSGKKTLKTVLDMIITYNQCGKIN